MLVTFWTERDFCIISDLFLIYFWLQEFIQQQILKLMNKQKVSLTQQIHNLNLKNPLGKNVKKKKKKEKCKTYVFPFP